MKKCFALFLALMMVFSLAACGGSTGSAAASAEGSAGSAQLPTLRVAAMPFITSLPTYYIQPPHLGENYGFQM